MDDGVLPLVGYFAGVHVGINNHVLCFGAHQSAFCFRNYFDVAPVSFLAFLVTSGFINITDPPCTYVLCTNKNDK